MRLSIAFVCTANVCRSPIMHFTFRTAIAARGAGRQCVVASRGTRAASEQLCSLSAKFIGEGSDALDFTRSHTPRSITAQFAATQHILLTASRAERAHLASLAPECRGRTFTVREATALGELPATAVELARSKLLVQGKGLTPFEAYADLLHCRRGLSTVPTTTRTAWVGLLGRPSNPLDIMDGHNSSPQAHRRAVRLAAQQAELLARQIVDFLHATG